MHTPPDELTPDPVDVPSGEKPPPDPVAARNGCLILIVLIVVIIGGIAILLRALNPPPQVLEYPDFRISYSYPWQPSDAADWIYTCNNRGFDCASAFAIGGNEETAVLIGRFEIDSKAVTVASYEAETRVEILRANAGSRYVRVEALTVGGQPAVGRVIAGLPNSDGSDGRDAWVMTIYVINGGRMYEVFMFSANEQRFEADLPAVKNLVAGIEFR